MCIRDRHLSSSYAKLLGETNFHTREIPRSEVGQKQKTERRRERLNDGNNNGQATHGARKHAWRTQAAWANFKTWQRVKILQGLRVVLASITKQVEKAPENQLFS